MRSRLAAVAPEEAQTAGAAAAGHVTASPPWRRARGVLLYAAVHGEVDTCPLAQAAWRDGKRLFLPSPRPTDLALAPVTWRQGVALVPGPYGIPVPAEGAPPGLGDIDLVVVPGLAFDRTGGRMGSGLGYYDRWLGAHPEAVPLGLAHSWQVVAVVPMAPHDVPLAWLATPDGAWPCGAAP